MYRFVDLNESARNRMPWGLETLVNGVSLDRKYGADFRTLNVSGRGLLAPENSFTDKVGTDGSWIDGSYYPARHITVEVLIQSKSLREVYQALNRDFYSPGTELLRLQFTDDMEWYWEAKLGGVSEVKEDSNNQVLELEFICPDPFKYSTRPRQVGKGNILSGFSGFPVRPDRISIKTKSRSDLLQVINETTGQRIVLEGGFNSGTEVRINFLETKLDQMIRSSNGSNLIQKLSIWSDFETFTISKDDKILTKPANAELVIEYRERSL